MEKVAHIKRFVLFASTCCLLTACNGTTNTETAATDVSPPETPPAGVSIQSPSDISTGTVQNVRFTTVNGKRIPIQATVSNATSPLIQAFQNEPDVFTNGSNLLRVVTTGSGNLDAVSVSTISNAHVGGFISRNGDVNLPSSGTATYAGGYSGYVHQSGGVLPIRGTANVDVDFANSTVGGSITNRQVTGVINADIPSRILSDVTLEQGALSADASYSTDARGSFSSGTATGAIGGNDANETAGFVKLTHLNALYGSTTFIGEDGVFSGSSQ